MDKHPGGRPTKFTPELGARIAKHMERGHFLKHAAALEHVSREVVYDWLERGRVGKEGDEEFVEFLHTYAHAEAKAVDRALRHVRQAKGGKDATPHLKEDWFLERRCREEWGRQVTEVQHSGAVGVVRVDGAESLTEDALRALKAGGR